MLPGKTPAEGPAHSYPWHCLLFFFLFLFSQSTQLARNRGQKQSDSSFAISLWLWQNRWDDSKRKEEEQQKPRITVDNRRAAAEMWAFCRISVLNNNLRIAELKRTLCIFECCPWQGGTVKNCTPHLWLRSQIRSSTLMLQLISFTDHSCIYHKAIPNIPYHYMWERNGKDKDMASELVCDRWRQWQHAWRQLEFKTHVFMTPNLPFSSYLGWLQSSQSWFTSFLALSWESRLEILVFYLFWLGCQPMGRGTLLLYTLGQHHSACM